MTDPYLVERELGRESRQYAEVIVRQWGDGRIISNRDGSHFGCHALAYAFQAWRTATGIDYFKRLRPWGHPVEEPRWVAYTMMPHNERTAWIDHGDGSRPSAFARAAPILHDGLSQWFSDRGVEWLRERWQRVACYDPSIEATRPDLLPLAYILPGATSSSTFRLSHRSKAIA